MFDSLRKDTILSVRQLHLETNQQNRRLLAEPYCRQIIASGPVLEALQDSCETLCSTAYVICNLQFL